MANILLVEDDKALGYILKEYLTLHHFEVLWCQEGREALACIQTNTVDLAILDVSLPSMDGFELARKIKGVLAQLPVIFLTARSLKVDKLKGFSLGADDYMVKPVEEEELVARIHAVLARYKFQVTNNPFSPIANKKIGKYEFDPATQELVVNSNIQKLTKRETELLALLMENKNKMVERKFLLDKLWEGTSYFTRRSMDVHISKLRKYLSHDPNLSIENVHNKGFALKEKS